ncbi:hypothetical protein tb265_12490 [Gemmatimonadetes bacterium T265]|nr:hypothetical protein tb265_12490 [Gemmatimonadetes bacterium T265]
MADMPGMNMRDVPTSDTAAAGMTMHAPDPLGIPMARTGSGTSWTPDAVSLPMYMTAAGSWDLMLHGAAFGQYDAQGGPRGRSQVGSLNWGMVMASHALVGGRFQARTMLSLDPATVTRRGYPLLLQSGESYDGRPLYDRQHPHNVFMEVSARYERPVTRTLGISLYVAPSGDPALGPVAFMHRPSAMDVPTAPIGHHWQDATHTTFGVVTAGLFTRAATLEVSAFNGREPDQDRYGFDRIRLNSYAGRLTVNPSVNWSLSGSYGALTSPEALHPEESIRRATASAMYGAPLGTAGQWATTLVWGANKYSTQPGLSHSGLVEAEAVLDRSNAVFGRAEVVQKSADDLSVDAAGGLTPAALSVLPALSPGTRFTVGAVSLGYVREVARLRGVTLGLGGMGTLNVVPSTLRDVYGSRTPVGGLVFLRVRPIGQRMASTDHGGHEHHAHE